MMDLLIKNGNVVFPDFTIQTTIGVDHGEIVAIGSRASMPKAEREIDAKGSFVLPGGVDPHDHITSDREGFLMGSKTTSWGGTTTLINFARGGLEGIEALRSEADSEVVIDYSLHATLENLSPDVPDALEEVKKLIDYGVPSFKLFMVYDEPADDNTVLKVLEACKTHGGLLCLHAENNEMVEYERAKAVKQGNKEAIYHALTRPPITEAVAVNMAIYLSSYLKAPYMNMHLSIKEGVDMLRTARKRRELVYGETCTHYLCKKQEDLTGPRGVYHICTPPFRTEEHIEALWEGLRDGTMCIVSSDHCGYSKDKKEGYDNFTQVPNGIPGHEFRLPVLFSEGVLKRNVSVNKLCEVFSTNAAKIFGLFPQKGVINVGSDADLVILDPKIEKTITPELSPSNIDWSPFEGMKVKGWPKMTIFKGRVIWEESEFQGKRGDGQFLKRSLPSMLFQDLLA